MSDQIEIRMPELPCRIGVLDGENTRPQPVVVGLCVELDLEAAGRSGRLDDTLDYAGVHAVVRRRILSERWTLIESLARTLVDDVLGADPRVRAVEVTVEKCRPPLGEASGPVRVRLRRGREAVT